MQNIEPPCFNCFWRGGLNNLATAKSPPPNPIFSCYLREFKNIIVANYWTLIIFYMFIRDGSKWYNPLPSYFLLLLRRGYTYYGREILNPTPSCCWLYFAPHLHLFPMFVWLAVCYKCMLTETFPNTLF